MSVKSELSTYKADRLKAFWAVENEFNTENIYCPLAENIWNEVVWLGRSL